MIEDKKILDLLDNLYDSKGLRVEANEDEIIKRSIEIKTTIVNKDYMDKGERMLLNFGHTIGHAIETFSDYKISHGEAVAFGMVMEARGAYKMGYCQDDYSEYLEKLLKKLGFEMRDSEMTAEDLLPFMAVDKKHIGQAMTIVVPRLKGNCILREITNEELKEFAFNSI